MFVTGANGGSVASSQVLGPIHDYTTGEVCSTLTLLRNPLLVQRAHSADIVSGFLVSFRKSVLDVITFTLSSLLVESRPRSDQGGCFETHWERKRRMGDLKSHARIRCADTRLDKSLGTVHGCQGGPQRVA